MELLNQSAFVFHSFQPRLELLMLKSGDDVSNMENDFVIILPGMIIALECKTTLGNSQFGEATKQWSKLKQVLEEELGLGDKFKFIKCLAYQSAAKGYEQREFCPQCVPYLFKWNGEEDFKRKIKTIIKDVPRKPLDVNQGQQFKSVVRDLLIFTSKRDDGSDAETRVADALFHRHSQIVNAPAETVFFWDPAQYDIIKDNKKLVILRGRKKQTVQYVCFISLLQDIFLEFGTGKTLLLAHRATELLKKGEEVLFLICYEVNPPIWLINNLRQHFDTAFKANRLDSNLLELMTHKQNSGEDLVELIEHKVKKQNVFVDEVTDLEVSYPLSLLEESELVHHLWIALRPGKSITETLEEMRDLKRVFRNQPNIIRYLRLNDLREENLEVDRNNPPVVTVFHKE